MTTALHKPLVSPMAKPKRDDEPVKVDREVLRVARIVAAFRGLTLAEYISERLRPLVTEDHDEEVQRAAGRIPPPKGKKPKPSDD